MWGYYDYEAMNTIEDTIWFETEKEAQDFARKYFKKFNNYTIEAFNEYM